MKIWVDADGLPREISDLLVRTALRRGVDLVRVANRVLPTHESALIKSVRVGAEFDAADRFIAEQVAPGDLVITADLPLAAAIVASGAFGLSPRGELFDATNVGEKLATRDLMTELRQAGLVGGGPASPSANDRKRFTDGLDRLLTRLLAQR